MSDNFRIDHDIPPPNGKTKYPWRELKAVGDSFFVPNVNTRIMSAQAGAAGKKFNMKFITRTVEGGCRIWRVK